MVIQPTVPLVGALTILLQANIGAAQETAPNTPALIATAMVEVPSIRDVKLSPDGEWVIYTVDRPSLETNGKTTEQLLQRISRNDAAMPAPTTLPAGARALQWCPDGLSVSMLLDSAQGSASFVRYHVATGKSERIPLVDAVETVRAANARPLIAEMSSDYQWSPRGNFVAFTSTLEAETALDPRRGVAQQPVTLNPHLALFVLDVASGAITQVTPGSVRVSGMDRIAWAPDETKLAVTVLPRVKAAQSDGDLIIVGREGGGSRPLVTRPGLDASPSWSPDGRWIAFSTHDGDARDQTGELAIVAVASGAITKFSSDQLPTSYSTDGWWSADSRAFHWFGSMDMTQRAARADVSRRTAALIPLPAGESSLPHDSNQSVSADGRWMAFTRESITAPPELFIVALSDAAVAQGTPRQLTHLTPDFPLGRKVRTEALSWQSLDRKFPIHGLLLTPLAAPSGSKLPTVVYFHGGPSMFVRGFASEGQGGAPLALAVDGYAVLIPNTRGRGGYGRAFQDAMRVEKVRAKGPLEDALSGIDLLIERGISDPKRLGVFGHSYGGYLTAYAVTATQRFKGAVFHEGGPLSLLDFYNFAYQRSDDWMQLLQRDAFGIHDPFDPAEQARMIAESPIMNANRITTPMLISCGSMAAGAPTGGCRHWFSALRRFNVPSAYFLYEEGHGYERPAALADHLTRVIEWLDHWVRDLPYPDAVRAREYGSWVGAKQ